MSDEFKEEENVLIPGQDYFTLNNCAFFRISANNGKMVSAKLFGFNDEEEFEEIETGIYPIETIQEALLWDEETRLILEYKPNGST